MNAELIRYNRAILLAELHGFHHYAAALRAMVAKNIQASQKWSHPKAAFVKTNS